MRRLTILLATAALLLAGCGDDDSTEAAETTTTTTEAPTTTETTSAPTTTEAAGPSLPTEACDQAFAEAAAVGDMQDTVEDLWPAGRVCESVADWTAAHEANPGAIDEGVDPVTFAENVCLYGEDMDSAPMCQELG